MKTKFIFQQSLGWNPTGKSCDSLCASFVPLKFKLNLCLNIIKSSPGVVDRCQLWKMNFYRHAIKFSLRENNRDAQVRALGSTSQIEVVLEEKWILEESIRCSEISRLSDAPPHPLKLTTILKESVQHSRRVNKSKKFLMEKEKPRKRVSVRWVLLIWTLFSVFHLSAHVLGKTCCCSRWNTNCGESTPVDNR